MNQCNTFSLQFEITLVLGFLNRYRIYDVVFANSSITL